ncbi:MAG: glucose-1-phosphate thymidylyltransferase [Muribaculaceae bacterium]|nr:glucose-1-phosphate thymidylyltransferase [Muribaculaceae bacterium]
MKNDRIIVLFDTEASHMNLLPLSYTRPVCNFRVGITTVREKWEMMLPGSYRVHPVEYLRTKFGDCEEELDDALFVAGALLPVGNLPERLAALLPGEAIMDGDEPVAFRGSRAAFDARDFAVIKELEHPDSRVRFVYDVFLKNGEMVNLDFRLLTAGRRSHPLDDSNLWIGPRTDAEGNPLVFVEEGATVEGAVINTKEGPVYIGRDVQVMEGACLRGPLGLCDRAKVKMGARVYGSTTIGPYCKVGGEIDNAVIFGYSNKAHDGYLGSAVIGEWCNLGAGTNCSNLKNDYSKIRIWNYARHTFMRTDLQFCGLIMGDHSKAGVNCMFNTATVVGVGVNVHGAGFPRVFIPSFLEGSAAGGFTAVPMKKFIDIAERVMARRGKTVTETDRHIFDMVHEIASAYK